VLIKDQSLLIPLGMLNACLIFSWPNNIPFDHEGSGTFQVGVNSDWQTRAEGDMIGVRRVSLRGGWVLIPGGREALGIMVHDCYPTSFT
jgi:hypothetical protein